MTDIYRIDVRVAGLIVQYFDGENIEKIFRNYAEGENRGHHPETERRLRDDVERKLRQHR